MTSISPFSGLLPTIIWGPPFQLSSLLSQWRRTEYHFGRLNQAWWYQNFSGESLLRIARAITRLFWSLFPLSLWSSQFKSLCILLGPLCFMFLCAGASLRPLIIICFYVKYAVWLQKLYSQLSLWVETHRITDQGQDQSLWPSMHACLGMFYLCPCSKVPQWAKNS